MTGTPAALDQDATYKTILLSYGVGETAVIATITLNRPEVLNALNKQVLTDLEHAFATLAANSAVHVILLTGIGYKAFAAGGDISEFSGVTPESGETIALRGQRILRMIETCGTPVIACINGFALGGGCELALACTFRIASDKARLGLPEVKLGILPGYGGTQRLPRLIGTSAAFRLLLTADTIGADEALRIGLIDEVVPGRHLLQHARGLALRIAANAPLAIAACMRSVHEGSVLPLEEATKLEARILAALCDTSDQREGATAFLEKRAPVWTGT